MNHDVSRYRFEVGCQGLHHRLDHRFRGGQPFVSAMKGHSEQEFRQACIEAMTRTEALDFMIDTLKATAVTLGRKAQEASSPEEEAPQ